MFNNPFSGWNYVFEGLLISVLGGFCFTVPSNLVLALAYGQQRREGRRRSV